MAFANSIENRAFLAFKDASNGIFDFYVYNKYSFFNAHKFKFSYIYLNRALWNNFFINYDIFLRSYGDQFDKNFYLDINKLLLGHFILFLNLLKDSDNYEINVSSYNALFAIRFFSILIDRLVTSKAFFNFLKLVAKLDNFSIFSNKL